MKIKEVSEKYGIPKDTLRYYEKIGLILRIKRNKNEVGEYTDADCKLIELIKHMRSAGFRNRSSHRICKASSRR